MSKHTPGPWFAVRGNAYWEVEPINAGNGVPFTVADVCPSEPGNPDGGLQEANARLIAAAPDLLEALELIIRHRLEELGPTLRVFAETAIAKAKGNPNA